jgi:hypothetical protein
MVNLWLLRFNYNFENHPLHVGLPTTHTPTPLFGATDLGRAGLSLHPLNFWLTWCTLQKKGSPNRLLHSSPGCFESFNCFFFFGWRGGWCGVMVVRRLQGASFPKIKNIFNWKVSSLLLVGQNWRSNRNLLTSTSSSDFHCQCWFRGKALDLSSKLKSLSDLHETCSIQALPGPIESATKTASLRVGLVCQSWLLPREGGKRSAKATVGKLI